MTEFEQEIYDMIEPHYGITSSIVGGRLQYRGVTRMHAKRALLSMVNRGLLVARPDNERLEDVYHRVDHIQQQEQAAQAEADRWTPTPYEDPELYPEILAYLNDHPNCQNEVKARALTDIALRYTSTGPIG